MRRIAQIVGALVCLAVGPVVDASMLEIRMLDRTGRNVEVEARGASMYAYVRATELRTGVDIIPEFSDFAFDADVRGDGALETFLGIAERLGLEVREERGRLIVTDATESTVSLDVSRRAAEEIVASLAAECGFRNVWIPRPLGVKGTFRFEEVPCSIALRTVIESLDLTTSEGSNGILLVERR